MNGEANRVRTRQNRAIIAADVRRFGHVINTDEVLGTHRTPIPYIAHLLAVAATVLEYDGLLLLCYTTLLRIRVVSHACPIFVTASAIELQISCAPAQTR